MEKETWYSKIDARFFYGQGFLMGRRIFSWVKTLGSGSIAMIWAFSPFSPCPKCFCIGVHTLPPIFIVLLWNILPKEFASVWLMFYWKAR